MIDLSSLEAGQRYAGDYAADLLALQKRLAHAHNALGAHRRRAIVVLESWSGIGADDILRRLSAALDPRFTRAWKTGAPTADEAAHPFLRRFWRRLPEPGEIALFDGSWYRRVLIDRVAGEIEPAACRRACDAINEFEAAQVAEGAILVKLFVHLRADVHADRLSARTDEPWLRWTVSEADRAALHRRAEYRSALDAMFAQTDMRWAPWCAIDGNARKAARIAALRAIVEPIEGALPPLPPPSGADA